MDIIALLDKPSTKSFGMIPVIARSDGRAFHVLDGHPVPQSVEAESVGALCAAGHAYDVSAIGAVIDGLPRPLVAGWLGTEFLARVREIGAPEPKVPDARFVFEPYGSFWVDVHGAVYETLKNWTIDAARQVFAERNVALADLMKWALPDENETVAAVWWTRKSEDERERYLGMVARVHDGQGRSLDVKLYKSILGSIVKAYGAAPSCGA